MQDSFNKRQLTDEQKARESILFDLVRLMPRHYEQNEQYRQILSGAKPLWLHFTDFGLRGIDDIKRLFDEGILEVDQRYSYIPNGTWQDHFPPSAYRLTLKGYRILRYTAQWVFDGRFPVEDDSETTVRRISEWRPFPKTAPR